MISDKTGALKMLCFICAFSFGRNCVSLVDNKGQQHNSLLRLPLGELGFGNTV